MRQHLSLDLRRFASQVVGGGQGDVRTPVGSPIRIGNRAVRVAYTHDRLEPMPYAFVVKDRLLSGPQVPGIDRPMAKDTVEIVFATPIGFVTRFLAHDGEVVESEHRAIRDRRVGAIDVEHRKARIVPKDRTYRRSA